MPGGGGDICPCCIWDSAAVVIWRREHSLVLVVCLASGLVSHPRRQPAICSKDVPSTCGEECCPLAPSMCNLCPSCWQYHILWSGYWNNWTQFAGLLVQQLPYTQSMRTCVAKFWRIKTWPAFPMLVNAWVPTKSWTSESRRKICAIQSWKLKDGL